MSGVNKPVLTIYNIGTHVGLFPSAMVRVDRGTNWGNPFIMSNASSEERERVCVAFESYAAWRLTIDPHWLTPLRGKHLGCWCAPKRCHAETLMCLANL